MELFGPLWDADAESGAAMTALLAELQRRHRGSIEAVLFYGSCLRSGDLHDGLVDLYLIVSGYRDAHFSMPAVIANALLPPNVYYLQVCASGRTVRCKYAVLSRAGLARATSARWFQPYIWGRFCQPVAIAWYRDEAVLADVRESLRRACLTFLSRVAPVVPARGTVPGLWQHGLALSYGTELRAERAGRSSRLVDDFAPHYRAVLHQLAPHLPQLALQDDDRYEIDVSRGVRATSTVAWRARMLQGKLLSVLRLLKALFTFEGGFDYIAWKLERHSGRAVVVPESVRRFPLLLVWGFMWKLYRQGYFR